MASKLLLAYVTPFSSIYLCWKKIWLSEPCIYIDITINLDISYETDHIIYVVLGKLCTIMPNIVVEAHVQRFNPHGGVCRNIAPNSLKHP